MKVILTEDVEQLGQLHEVVEVANGYARNFLLPRSLAIPATPSAMSNLDNMKRVGERRMARQKVAADELAGKLSGQTIVMDVKVGTGGRLYGSISAGDIAAQVQKTLGIEIDKKTVQLDDTIRQTGLYRVPVKLHRDVVVTLPVEVGDAPAGGWPNADENVATEAAVEAEAVAV
ncbi:MAG TPA: 50S ribosomal protein L9 [Abditibacteriaceae bacterium]|jgi:large subunit ribosomal protein L9